MFGGRRNPVERTSADRLTGRICIGRNTVARNAAVFLLNLPTTSAGQFITRHREFLSASDEIFALQSGTKHALYKPSELASPVGDFDLLLLLSEVLAITSVSHTRRVIWSLLKYFLTHVTIAMVFYHFLRNITSTE